MNVILELILILAASIFISNWLCKIFDWILSKIFKLIINSIKKIKETK